TLSGRVVDEANMLDPATRAALTQKLAELEAKTTDQLVVVTLRSLQGTSIEDFGVELGRRWRIGQKDKNNGVLLIVAPSERKVRIEVGYGLEGTLTNAVSKLIIENAIIPRFRANDIPGGITRAVDDIVNVLTGDAEEWKQRAAKAALKAEQETPAPSPARFTIRTNTEAIAVASLLTPPYVRSISECEQKCAQTATCKIFTYNKRTEMCYTYTDAYFLPNEKFDSGAREPVPTNFIKSDPPLSSSSAASFEKRSNMKASGVLINRSTVSSIEECEKKCTLVTGCKVYTFHATAKFCDLYSRADLMPNAWFDAGVRIEQ